HKCDLLRQWLADPRCPLEEQSTGYFLAIGSDANLKIEFCPFCGEGASICDSHRPPPAACQHLEELAAAPGSTVRFCAKSGEYELVGLDSLKVRLFFCPVCGRRLPLSNNKDDFYEMSPAELATWRQASEGVKSIADALERFGA